MSQHERRMLMLKIEFTNEIKYFALLKFCFTVEVIWNQVYNSVTDENFIKSYKTEQSLISEGG